MRHLDRLGAARQSLTDAINRATDADTAGAETDVFAAELQLRRGGRPDLARRLEALLTGDVTTRDGIHELRTVAQKIDAELDPDVTTASFVPASDGGERL